MELKSHARSKNRDRALSKELNELIGDASGGFLFGIPLLYPMEVWFIGSEVQPPILSAILAITFAVVLLLNRAEGFRRSSSGGFWPTILSGDRWLRGIAHWLIRKKKRQTVTLERYADGPQRNRNRRNDYCL